MLLEELIQYMAERVDDTPSKFPKMEQAFRSVLDDINLKCQPFLQNAGGFLIRGSHSMNANKPGKRSVRKDREPTDTSPCISKLYDMMYTKLNAPLRSESVFAYGLDGYNMSASSWYGNLFMVFPVGEYNMSYLNDVEDLVGTSALRAYNGEANGTELPDSVANLITSNNTLDEVINSVELAMADENFVELVGDDELLPKLLSNMTSDMKLFTDSLVLNQPIIASSYSEITVDCDEYIYVPLGKGCTPYDVELILRKLGLTNHQYFSAPTE